MNVNVGQLLKKNIIHARLNHFLGSLHVFLRVKAIFLASGNVFSIECYSFRRAETVFFGDLLYRANFVRVETINQIEVKPFLIE